MIEEKLYLYGISRVDREAEHYWVVRLHYIKGKPSQYGIFHDNTHGDISQSFVAAVIFRDTNVKREMIKRNIYNQELDHIKEENSKSEKWKKERIRRRLKTIEKNGRNKIIVGTGIEAARKARGCGASKITCWKIKSGRQDFYTVWNFMPGVDLNWKDRPTHQHPDIEKQKENGKKKFILGVGREAAVKAQELGASKKVCLGIFRGKKNFFNCCNTIPHFEAGGFKRELTQEVIDKINHTVARYIRNRPLDVAAEVMLNYASRDQVNDKDDLITKLVLKYNRIIRLQNDGSYQRQKKMVSLDIDGNIERFNDTGKRKSGKGLTFLQ